jgi:hypothetical protein
MKKTTSLSLALLSASILAACGGGGSPSSPPPVVASKMAAYAGVWSAPCAGHELVTLTVTESSAKDTITVASKSEYFMQSGCTGAIVGTETQSANYTVAHTGVADAGVVFTQGGASVPTKIDLVTLSAPALRVSIVGTGVSHGVENGQTLWCMAYENGNRECVVDQGLEAATPPTSTAMHVGGNKLYVLTASGTSYLAGTAFTKR